MENDPPFQPEYYLYYALIRKDLKYPDYIHWVNTGLSLFPDEFRLVLIKVEWLAEQAKFSEALNLLNSIKNRLPADEYQRIASYLMYNIGVVYYHQDRKKESAEWFYQAWLMYPSETKFLRNYIIVLAETDRREEAKREAEKYLKLHPQDTELTRLLIQLYSETNDLLKLESLLVKQIQSGGSREDSLLLARYYLYTGKVYRGFDLLETMKKKNPSSRDPYELELDFWEKQVHRQKMDSLLREMEKIFPGDTTILNKRFKNFMEMDSIEAANRMLSRLLEKDSLNFTYHKTMLENLKKIDQHRWKSYLERLEQYPLGLEEMAYIAHLWVEEGEFFRAKKIYQELRFVGYESAKMWTDLGIIYRIEDKKDSAEYCFRKAMDSREGDYRAFLQMAQIAGEEKDTVAMQLYLEVGLEIILGKLGMVQAELSAAFSQNNSLLRETVRLKEQANESYRLENDFHQWISWYSEQVTATGFEQFVQRFVQRFPSNKHLYYILGKYYLQKGEEEKIRPALEKVLYLDRFHIPARRLLIQYFLDREKNPEEAFLHFRQIFSLQPDSLSAKDYKTMIALAGELNQRGMLAQEWILAFDKGYREEKFVLYLVEILHLAGFHDKAREITRSVKKDDKMVRINPYLEILPATKSKGILP